MFSFPGYEMLSKPFSCSSSCLIHPQIRHNSVWRIYCQGWHTHTRVFAGKATRTHLRQVLSDITSHAEKIYRDRGNSKANSHNKNSQQKPKLQIQIHRGSNRRFFMCKLTSRYSVVDVLKKNSRFVKFILTAALLDFTHCSLDKEL